MPNGNQSIIQSIMLAPSIQTSESMCVDKKDNKIDTIKGYLKNAALLMDKRKVEKIKKRYSLYYMENN